MRSSTVKHITKLRIICGAFAAVLCSCSREGALPGERDGKVDIQEFIFAEITKYGGVHGSNKNTTTLNALRYSYSEDADGFQLICQGDKVEAFASLLKPVFGAPKMETTNEFGLSSFVYGVQQAGVGINCGLEVRPGQGMTNQMTHLVVVKSGVL